MVDTPTKISALPAGTQPTGAEVGPFVQSGATVKLTTAQVAAGLNITRAQIPTLIVGNTTFIVTGYSTPGDIGQGAVYTSVGATSGSLLAIQDAAGTWFRLLANQDIKVGWFGATGDGLTDDSVAIQAAIDYAEGIGGGHVIFPDGQFLANVVLKEGVQLTAESHGQHANPTIGIFYTTINAVTGGAVVDTPVGLIHEIGIIGICLVGLGAGVPCIGLHLRNVNRTTVESCAFNNFADQAILWDAGLALNCYDLFATNCLLNRTRSQISGVFELYGTDGFFHRNEVTASTSGKTVGEQCCAWYIGGSNHFITDCIGEISDMGFYVDSVYAKINSCRSDNNSMEGFHITGIGNHFNNCHSLSNGRETTNTYSAFLSTVDASQNIFIGCFANNQFLNYKYCFEDDNATLSLLQRNAYIGCFGTNFGTALTKVSTTESTYYQTLGYWLQVSGATTYSVNNVGLLEIGGGAAKTITALTDGIVGQVVRIIVTNANITIQNNASLVTNTGADKLLAVAKIYTFTCVDASSTFVENA